MPHVTSIYLENILCLPPKVTLRLGALKEGEGQLIAVTGGNEVGKTSLLKGIETLSDGDHSPDIITRGQKRAVVDLELDNGTRAHRVITKKGYTLEVTTAGSDVPEKSPETYIKALFSGIGFSPLRFIRMSKKERLELALSTGGVKFSAGEIEAIISPIQDSVSLPEKWEGSYKELKSFLKTLTELRATIGSRRDEKASTVESLRKSLAEGDNAADPRDWKEVINKILGARNFLDQEERAALDRMAADTTKSRLEVLSSITRAEIMAREEYARLTTEAQKGHDCDFDATLIQSACIELSNNVRFKADIDRASSEEVRALEASYSSRREALASELATARAAHEAQVSAGAIRKRMVEIQAEAQALTTKYDLICDAVKAIETLKRTKLDGLDLAGGKIGDDDDIYYDGVSSDGKSYSGVRFDNLNTATKFKKVLQIGGSNPGSVPIMIADEGECLDDMSWAELEEAAKESGYHVIVAVRGNGPLRAEPEGVLVTA